MLFTIDFWIHTLHDAASFWAAVAAVFSAVIAIVAYFQLRNLAQISKSEFLGTLKKDFFTEDARRLMLLVDNDLLEFHGEGIPYFLIVGAEKPGVVERLDELGIKSPTISAYLVEDVLLGPLEDLGVLEKLKRVSIEEAYEHFDAYVTSCAENRAIGDYLKWSVEGEDDDVYDDFLALYGKLVEQGPRIRKNKRNSGIKSTSAALPK
jgi:hypothetical protein